jgi:hypothetical protein
MAKKKKVSLFDVFIGEFVEILTGIEITTSAQSESEITQQVLPLYFYGYFLDSDDDYIYLGENPKQICRALRLDEVKMIQIQKEPNELDDLLESLPTPKERKDFN